MKDVSMCALSDTHARLNQAYEIFKTIAFDYQDVDKFTGHLNNLLQTLRNVTFILQAEKSKIPDFESWYGTFQQEMKDDELMRWLVDSRNHVVKRGDLEKVSTLTARIKNHDEQTLFSAEFNPLISLKEAASRFNKRIKLDIPSDYLDETLIEFERRWVVNSYPNAEILDLLIYCFSQVTKVVFFAHQQAGSDFIKCQKNSFLKDGEDFMVLLHNEIRRYRTIKTLYESGKEINFEMGAIPREKVLNLGDVKKVKERYGNQVKLSKLLRKSKGELPFSHLEFHTEMAKSIFAVDGYHQTMAFLYFPDGSSEVMQFTMANPYERYLMPEQIAQRVEATHCEALIFVGEMWIGEAPKKGEIPVPPRKQENKKEQLSIVAASPNKTLIRVMPITRDKEGKPSLGETSDIEGEFMYFLNKIYKHWKYVRKADDIISGKE